MILKSWTFYNIFKYMAIFPLLLCPKENVCNDAQCSIKLYLISLKEECVLYKINKYNIDELICAIVVL